MDENNNQVNYGPDPVNPGPNPGPNPNQQPPVYNTTEAVVDPGQGLATGALVCGIIGLCCCGICNIVAIVLGVMARNKCTTESNKKKATAGLILGIVGLVLSIIITIVNLATGVFSNLANQNTSSYDYYYYGY